MTPAHSLNQLRDDLDRRPRISSTVVGGVTFDLLGSLPAPSSSSTTDE